MPYPTLSQICVSMWELLLLKARVDGKRGEAALNKKLIKSDRSLHGLHKNHNLSA